MSDDENWLTMLAKFNPTAAMFANKSAALEARIRELEADRDHWASQAGPDSCADLCRQRDEAVARVAELEAERDEYHRRMSRALLEAASANGDAAEAVERTERAETRVAELEAALRQYADPNGWHEWVGV